MSAKSALPSTYETDISGIGVEEANVLFIGEGKY
jgi:hypothetical protein